MFVKEGPSGDVDRVGHVRAMTATKILAQWEGRGCMCRCKCTWTKFIFKAINLDKISNKVHLDKVYFRSKTSLKN